MISQTARRNVSLRPYTTLRAGGPADLLITAHSADELALLAAEAQRQNTSTTILGWGSNVLPADAGVAGLTLVNRAEQIVVMPSGEVIADSGCGFQELFLKTAQAGLEGLSFAVGIPGTLGGALVSNAGAYRKCISDFLTGIEIVENGERRWVQPSYMQFRYRDSILRSPNPPALCLIRVALKLERGSPKAIYDAARDYQRQRISKQPPPASAGSFFKNVEDAELAQRLPGLPDPLRVAGVVPAGFLLERAGLKGRRVGGAMLGMRHANFILNVGQATASEIRDLADLARQEVFAHFGVKLEEEVLYLGRW